MAMIRQIMFCTFVSAMIVEAEEVTDTGTGTMPSNEGQLLGFTRKHIY